LNDPAPWPHHSPSAQTYPSDPHYQRTLDNIEYAASLLDAYTFDRALSEFLTLLMHDIEQLRAQIKQKEEEEKV
jgi:hypothetical protein